MKIAIELLHSAPNASMKGSAPSESGADFHGTLNAAAAARASVENETRQVNPKQTQNTKPGSAEPKKKDAASTSSPSESPLAAVEPLKPASQAIAIQVPVALPANDNAAADNPSEAFGQIPGILSGGLSTDGITAQQNLTAPVGKKQDFTTADGTQKTSLTPTVISSVPPAVTTPASDGVIPKSPLAEKTDEPADLSGNSNAPSAADPANTANATAQQSAAAAAQSVAASNPLPSMGSVNAVKPSSEIATGKTPDVSGLADSLKQTTSRQAATTPSKAKPVSPASDARSKATGENDGDTQTVAAQASGTPPLKVPDAPALSNHVAADTRGGLGTTLIQAIPPTATPDNSAHIAQTTLSGSDPTQTTPQNAPVQAPSDPQAMPGITGAQLTQSMRSSEMKLGMQSTEFGNISISTSLNHQAISAQISIDHAELGRALAVHLPAIEEKLGSAYGVQARVELRESNNPSSSSESGYSNSGQQSREQRQSETGSSSNTQGAMFDRVANRSTLTPANMAANGSRLDIRI